MSTDKQTDPGAAYLDKISSSDPGNDIIREYGDVLRQACNYVASHKEYFGHTILELNCATGLMTGFLAGTFPGSKIIAIDENESALRAAEKRIADSRIGNVEFRNCSAGDVDGLFDTVFSMGTLPENMDEHLLPYAGEPLLYQFAVCKKVTRNYTRLLAEHLNETGTLCVFERIGHDPLLCGWLLELESIPCGILPDTCEEVYCREGNAIGTFQAFAARKGHKNTLKEVLDLWYAPVNQYDSGMLQLSGYKALDYLERNAGKLIRGFRIYDDKSGEQIGRFARFRDRDDDLRIYLFVSAGSEENITLVPYDWSIEEELREKLQEMAETNRKLGFRYEEIDPSDKILEGNIRIGFVKKY